MALKLFVEKLWNGDPCPEPNVHSVFTVRSTREGLLVRAQGNLASPARVPDAPRGARVNGLWNFDVLELFLVGTNKHYLELELGAGGHYLILSFDAVRHCSNEHSDTLLDVHYEQHSETSWVSEVTIPWDVLPKKIHAMNAYMVVEPYYLAMHPVPGNKPDFHQPDAFPWAMIT